MAEINITNAKTAWVSPLVYSIILIIAGIAMVVFKSESLKWILIVSGVFMVIGNAIDLAIALKMKVVAPIPIIGIILGVLLIVLPGLMGDILMVLLGVFLILYGILNIAGAIINGESLIAMILGIAIGVLAIIAGIYALFYINDTKDIVMIVKTKNQRLITQTLILLVRYSSHRQIPLAIV